MTNPVSKDTSVDSFSGYPSSALDGASRRISAMYENIISADEDEDEDEGDTQAIEENLPVMDDEQGSEAQLSPLSAHLRRRLSQTRPDNPGDMGHNDPTRTRKRRCCEQACDAHFDTLARRALIVAE